MLDQPFPSRQERFATVGSTNDVVRDWLTAGTPEICLAVADRQTAGRGREGRSWIAPPGAALLLSLGFRPTYVDPGQVWRLAATVSLAMADAAEQVGSLPHRAIRLKWPNDLVIEETDPSGGQPVLRKLAGVLGETAGLGSSDPRAVVGIGLNADWPESRFPPDLAPGMTSLRVASGGGAIDTAALLAAFLTRVEARMIALRAGRFNVAEWADRQVTTGRRVGIESPTGVVETRRALGVDAATGALVVDDPGAPGGERLVHSGEIRHLRLAPATGAAPRPAPVEV